MLNTPLFKPWNEILRHSSHNAMGDRDRDRDRVRERDRDRDRDRERRRDRDDRDHRDRRSKRSHTPDLPRSRHARSRTRSPDRYRSRSHTLSRSRSPDDRSHRRRHHHHRTPSPESRKRHRRESAPDDERERQKAVSDFVDGIAKEQQKQKRPSDNGSGGEAEEDKGGGGGGEVGPNEDEIEMMRMMGIPVGFDSTKGKHVPGADVSGVRAVSKRQPRQYMNRRGGFNRPLPAERTRWHRLGFRCSSFFEIFGFLSWISSSLILCFWINLKFRVSSLTELVMLCYFWNSFCTEFEYCFLRWFYVLLLLLGVFGLLIVYRKIFKNSPLNCHYCQFVSPISQMCQWQPLNLIKLAMLLLLVVFQPEKEKQNI